VRNPEAKAAAKKRREERKRQQAAGRSSGLRRLGQARKRAGKKNHHPGEGGPKPKAKSLAPALGMR
jgi:hypothetical protein